eukprot:2354380-Amphidinium_carterae.3
MLTLTCANLDCACARMLPKFKALVDKNIKTMKVLAFACAYQPCFQDDSAFVKLVEEPSPRAAEISTTQARLSDAPLPQAERETRLKQVRAMLRGLRIRGLMEPSETLIDACCHMMETGRLTWLPWDASLPSRPRASRRVWSPTLWWIQLVHSALRPGR